MVKAVVHQAQAKPKGARIDSQLGEAVLSWFQSGRKWIRKL